MTLRSFIGVPVKWVLRRAGLDIISRDKFGYDPYLDIVRLGKTWRYPLTMFFDVGANKGQTTLIALERFPDCRIMAFEPHSETFMLLKQHVRDPRVDLINAALGSEVCDKTMFEYDVSLGNSLVDNAPFAVRFDKESKTTIGVPCTTVDDICAEQNIKTIDVLKIDTEGFDHEVLKGAALMLKRKAIKFIFFEFNDVQPKDGTTGGALVPIDALLRPHGFRFIASYNDYVVTIDEPFLVSNALYALPPR